MGPFLIRSDDACCGVASDKAERQANAQTELVTPDIPFLNECPQALISLLIAGKMGQKSRPLPLV
jgi:hypothetical protein